jgi:membrane associated rhomboid family serine protease
MYQMSLGLTNDLSERNFIIAFGLIPAQFSFFNIFTSMFIHGGIAHIAGNMWFLWIFGDNVESALGHMRYLMFYLICGLVAALSQVFLNSLSQVPMVGASGAIAGVLGAYMMMYPKARVHVFIVFVFITTIQIPAQIVLGIWFLMQLSNGLGTLGLDTTGGVAWFAHIGGFIAGVGGQKIFRTFRVA